MTDALRKRLHGADIMFFDGTTFEDDEMIRLGLLPKTAWRMGHMAMNGEKGSIARARRSRHQAARFRPHQQFQSGVALQFGGARAGRGGRLGNRL